LLLRQRVNVDKGRIEGSHGSYLDLLDFKIMNSTPLTYQIIDHTADLGIIVEGTDEKNLFIRAAYAMTDLMVEDDISKKTVIKDVSLQGEDFPDLMVRWLGEVLYLFDGENLIVNSIEIKSISPIQLKSTLTLTSEFWNFGDVIEYVE